MNIQTFFQMAGTKGKSGGRRVGAGRKSKAEEEKSKKLSLEAIVDVFGSERDAFIDMATKAKEGSTKHLELLFAYAYGKPVKNVDLKAKHTLEMDNKPDWMNE